MGEVHGPGPARRQQPRRHGRQVAGDERLAGAVGVTAGCAGDHQRVRIEDPHRLAGTVTADEFVVLGPRDRRRQALVDEALQPDRRVGEEGVVDDGGRGLRRHGETLLAP